MDELYDGANVEKSGVYYDALTHAWTDNNPVLSTEDFAAIKAYAVANNYTKVKITAKGKHGGGNFMLKDSDNTSGTELFYVAKDEWKSAEINVTDISDSTYITVENMQYYAIYFVVEFIA